MKKYSVIGILSFAMVSVGVSAMIPMDGGDGSTYPGVKEQMVETPSGDRIVPSRWTTSRLGPNGCGVINCAFWPPIESGTE